MGKKLDREISRRLNWLEGSIWEIEDEVLTRGNQDELLAHIATVHSDIKELRKMLAERSDGGHH